MGYNGVRTEDCTNRMELKVLGDLIADGLVLGSAAACWDDDGLLRSREANIIAGWCIKHWRKHGRPLGRGIVSVLEGKQASFDESTFGLLHGLVSNSKRYWDRDGQPNSDSTVSMDRAGVYVRTNAAKKTAEGILNDLAAGRLEQAESRIGKFRRIEMGSDSGVHLFTDEQAVRSTFAQAESLQLVKYPGALGRHFANEMEEEGFVAFCGPQKSGKSWWLIDVAWRAMLGRRRVAYFHVGDMTQRQIKFRFLVRAAKHPYRSPTQKWPCSIRVPVGIRWREGKWDSVAEVTDHETRTFDGPLDPDSAWQACERVMRSEIKTKNSCFQLSCHPNRSVNVLDIRSKLDSWSRQGWEPEVIIIDYVDNFGPVDKREERRDQINTSWSLLRALSYETHRLVVTATQVNAAGFRKFWLDRENFAEDNRKLNHPTGMVGVNVTPKEKDSGICRLNWIVKRESGYSVHHGPSVAGCLALCDVSSLSTYKEKE